MRWGYVISNLITILMSCRKLLFIFHFFADTHRNHPHPNKVKNPKQTKNQWPKATHTPLPQNSEFPQEGKQAIISLTRMLLSISCMKLMTDWEVMPTLGMSGVCHPGTFCWWLSPGPKGTSTETWVTPPASVSGLCLHAYLAVYF